MLCTCHVNAEVNAYVHSVNQQGLDVTHHIQHVIRCCVHVNQCHVTKEVNTDARNVNPGNHNVNLEVPLLMSKFKS